MALIVKPKPNIQTGYAKNASEAEFPWLWRGCVGAWPIGMQRISDTIYDLSGHRNHGSLVNLGDSDWLITDRGRNLDFDDSKASSVDVPNTPILNFGTGDFSAACWVYMDNPNAVDHAILSKGKGGAGGKRWLIRTDNSNRLEYEIDDDVVKSTTLSATARTINVWFHLAVTFNRSGNAIAYVNGSQESSGSISASSGSIDDVSLPFRIGRETSNDNYHDGYIDDVLLYNRVLHPREIKLLSEVDYALFVKRQKIYSIGGGGGQTLLPGSISSIEAFGSTSVSVGEVSVLPAGIASPEAFGSHQLNLSLALPGIATAEAFGSHTAAPGLVSLLLGGVGSLEAFGSHTLTQPSGEISQDATSETTFNNVSSANWSHTCSGADRLLVVSVGRIDTNGRTITGVTYNGEALTQVGADNRDHVLLDQWYLVNPNTGLNTIAVTFSGAISHGGVGGAVSLNGVNQSSPLGSSATADAGTTSISVGVTGTVSGSWVVDSVIAEDDTPSVGANQTEFWSNERGTDEVVASSYEASSGGTITMSWSVGASNRMALVAGEFKVASGASTLIANAIASAEAFGGHTLAPGLVSLLPGGIASAEAFGSHALASIIAVLPGGIASAEAFGSHTAAPGLVSVSPGGIASIEVFGSHIVAAGVQTLLPNGVAGGELFGTTTLAVGLVAILPGGIASVEAFGAHTAAPGVTSVLPGGIATTEAFGSYTITQGEISLLPGGVASLEAFGSHTLMLGAVTLLPGGIASAEAFGSHIVAVGVQTLVIGGIATAEAFGSHTLALGVASIVPGGIASVEAFGAYTLAPGAILIVPGAIASAEAFGSHTVAQGIASIGPSGIASIEAFGNYTLMTGGVFVSPSGIASAEGFGAPLLALFLSPSGIAGAEAFGIGSLGVGSALVVPVGVLSAEAFGIHRALLNNQNIGIIGIPTGVAFGGGLTSLWPSLGLQTIIATSRDFRKRKG